jgi:hypothetical protein
METLILNLPYALDATFGRDRSIDLLIYKSTSLELHAYYICPYITI